MRPLDGGQKLPKGTALAVRIMRYTKPMENGCWRWSGAIDPSGYGRITVDGVARYVHRVTYELMVGPIPQGKQVDHRCGNRWCCNPDHLDPVTPRENSLRSATLAARNAIKTHCPKGHAYEGDNVRIWRGRRICRTCNIERSRSWRQSNRAA